MTQQDFDGENNFSPLGSESPAPRENSDRPERTSGDRPERSFGDRPRRDFGDRPERSFGDRPRRDFGDRPERSFGDRPRRDFGDRPERSFGDRPRRDFGDRPERSFGDRPRRDFGDRPERSFGDRPRRDFGDRPERSFGDRPERTFGDRPRREFGDRPERSFGDRPERSFGDRPRRDFGDRPERSFGDRPERSFGDRPRRDFGDRPERSFGDRPRRDFGDRQDRPRRDFNSDRFFDDGPGRPSFDRGPRGRSREDLPSFLRKVEALKTEKGREREGLFLVEGIRCIKEVLQNSPEVIEKVFYVEGFEDAALLAEIEKRQIKAEALVPNYFEAIASTQNSQGIVATARPAPRKPNWETAQVVTLVDGVQDPGNLGSIFRSCLGFGVDALVLGKGTCDPFNPKVVRGSSGTFLRVPFEQFGNLHEKILFLLTKGFSVVATTPHAVQSISDIKLRKKVAFLIGNEGNGADARLIDMCTEQVKIPMADGLESLNVAVAHGVLAYELSKSRSEV